MKPQTDWSRRTFLRGLGAAIALPSLPSALPLRGLAALGSQEEHPLRVAYMFVPNGMHMPDWTLVPVVPISSCPRSSPLSSH